MLLDVNHYSRTFLANTYARVDGRAKEDLKLRGHVDGVLATTADRKRSATKTAVY